MNEKILKYGLRLKAIRKKMQLTRKHIFIKYGFTESSIRRWELGESEIGIVTLENYLKVFNDYGVNIPLKAFIDLDRPIESKIKKEIALIE